MTDGIIGILQFAADSLSLQQQASANDIANESTPNFTAQEVSFEQSLQQAMQKPSGGTATATTYDSPALAQSNGNNVNLTEQLTGLDKSTLQSETMVQLLNDQFTMVTDAVTPPY